MRSPSQLALLASFGLAWGCAQQLPGIFEWEDFQDRSSGSMIPAAPPPPTFRNRTDIQVRELGAPSPPALTAGATGATGLPPLRSDGAIGVTITDWFAMRVLGAASYGRPTTIGAASVPISQRPPLVGGVGFVLGWWGDRAWSISLELDVQLQLLAGQDRYAVQNGHCSQGIGLFGPPPLVCSGAPTGELRFYEGYFGAPTFGSTLDVAGYAVSWLRLGASASVQGFITRGTSANASWTATGVARVFVEVHIDDVWIGLEAQGALADGLPFYPMLAATFGGSLADPTQPRRPAPPSPPGAWHAIVTER